MKLSEILNPATGPIINKKGKLLITIKLDNGETLTKGTVGSLLKDYGNVYHFETNDNACKVRYNEVEVIKE